MPAIEFGLVPDAAAPPGRIFLTGASGFVGKHLTAALAAAYPDAVLLTGSVDLRDGQAIEASIAAAQPDVCVHLAAIATQAAARHDEDRTWDINLAGSLRLGHALLQHAPDCQMLYISSADAYGGAGPSGAPINEDAPLAPKNLYAATKAAADLALGAMAEQGLRVVRLRPFNHTGPGQSADLVIPAFARQVARIQAGRQAPLLQVGNLDTWRDFLDVRDVCAAYIACIDRRNALAAGTIVNIGSGQPRRIGEVLAELMALGKVSAEVRTEPARTRVNEVARAFAGTAQAAALLGWKPAVPWSQTLADVLEDWHARVIAEPDC